MEPNSQVFAGIKTVPVSSSGATGPNSQIPGLSQTADETSPVERTSGRRVGIFASDSEYVKLAKGGGHKGKILEFKMWCTRLFGSFMNGVLFEMQIRKKRHSAQQDADRKD